MRSPQFLEGIQRYMEQTVNFRKITNDLMGKMRNELQSPSREDVDTIMVSVRHIEKRLLDRVDDLSAQVQALTRTEPRSEATLAVKGNATRSSSTRSTRSASVKKSRK